MSVSLYIHIPFCVSKCAYCDFFSKTDLSSIDLYVDALVNEINFRFKNSKPKIKTIYIGGGTPSLLNIQQILKIQNAIESVCNLESDLEFTIEVNPDDIDEDYLDKLKKSKINRISCGIQSMSNKVLEFSNRRSRKQQNLTALSLLQNTWNKNFSIDLICGLPEETEQSFLQGLRKILSFNPNHISMYSLTVEDETPLGNLINKGKIEYDYDFSDALWLKSKEILENAGYFQYEVSNFAKPGFESKHNLTYWNHQTYVGVGSGATGTIYFDGGEGFRYTNTTDIFKYIKFWNNQKTIYNFNDFVLFDKRNSNFEFLKEIQDEEFIDLETSKIEYFMMGLRKISGINSCEYFDIFGSNISPLIIETFEKWQKKGLCKISKSNENVNYTLGKTGIIYLNKFLTEIIN